MSRGIEDDIFDAGNTPEGEGSAPQEHDQGLPPTRPLTEEDVAVSQVIGELAKSTGRQPAPSSQPLQQPPQQQPPQAQPQQPPQEEDRSQGGLLRALLDERERRQEMQRRLQRFEQMESQQKEQRPPLAQRLFEDPDAVLNEIRESIRQESVTPLEQRLAQVTVQTDFALAGIRHGETFQKAWDAWYKQVDGGQDPQTYFAVMNSPSPGEALVNWYRQQEVQQEVGGDLQGYRERLREQLRQELMAEMGLGQPAPQAQEPGRQPNGQFAPKHQVRLPTATSRAGSGSPNGGIADVLDGSDDAIFDSARPRRK